MVNSVLKLDNDICSQQEVKRKMASMIGTNVTK